jgi:hypothetical protein
LRGNQGVYNEDVGITAAGTAAAPITLMGYPGDPKAVIQPPQGLPTGDHYALRFRAASHDVRVSGVVLQKSYAPVSASAVYFVAGTYADELSDSEVRDAGAGSGIFIDANTHDIKILRNRIHDNCCNHNNNQGHGIYMEGANDTIANNVIYNQPNGWLIQVYPANQNSQIIGNTLVAAGHSAIVVGGDGGVGGLTIRNNIIANNTNYALSHDSTCPTGSVLFDHNLIYNNPAGAVQSGCSQIDTSGGNTVANPLFVDYGNRDLRVQTGSPAIDAANGLTFSPDVNGVPRPVGAAPDTGAHER